MQSVLQILDEKKEWLFESQDKEGNKTPVIQKFERKYEEEDLIPDFMYSTEDEDYEDEIDDDTDSDENKSTSNDDNDWLNRL